MVFANKQDLPNALSVTELTEKLGLNTLRRKVRSIKRINLTYTGNNMMPVTYVTVFIDLISDSTHVDKDLTFGLGHFHKGITHWSATLGLKVVAQKNSTVQYQFSYGSVVFLCDSVRTNYCTSMYDLISRIVHIVVLSEFTPLK